MEFQSTFWTVIGQAKAGSRPALDTLLRRYRAPILEYLRFRGLSEHDAEDLVQEVFLEISEEKFLARADRSQGRFRSLLLRVTDHVLASHFRKQYRLKRGSGKKALPLESAAGEAAPDEDQFNGLWARNLIRIALDKLRRESSRMKVAYHEVLLLRFVDGLSYQEIAERLNFKPHDVDNYLYYGKKLLKGYLVDLAREYASSPDEHAEEIALLQRFLG